MPPKTRGSNKRDTKNYQKEEEKADKKVIDIINKELPEEKIKTLEDLNDYIEL